MICGTFEISLNGKLARTWGLAYLEFLASILNNLIFW